LNRYIIDASAAVEYLLRTPSGLQVDSLIANAEIAAPELMDAEVLSVLRRLVLSGELDQTRAETALDDLVHWPIDRISHRELIQLAWLHHRNLSAYDALYVAAARSDAMTLVTTDRRLSRATNLGIRVENVRHKPE
jgi:predicted nucleic acid-binding protein